MTDNSVSSANSAWSSHSASSACSDFKAAVCSSGENQWSSSSSCEQPEHTSCPTLNTTGFQSHAQSCGSLSTSGFQTDMHSCASLSTTGFHTNTGECSTLSTTGFHVNLPTCGCEEETTSCETPAPSCETSKSCDDSPTLKVTGDSVSDGMYTITASSDNGGEITITNDCSGKQITQIWGDPHVNDGTGTNVGEFTNENLTITLPDGTEVLMQPTAVSNGVAYLENATVTNGDDAVTMNGTDGAFSNGVTLSSVFPGAAGQQAIYANGATNLSDTASGSLYVENASGQVGAQVVATNGSAMDLDGLTSAAA